jgi:hypothetical protein
VRTARYLIVGFLVLWFVQETPYFFLQDLLIIEGKPVCLTTSIAFTQYHIYFVNFCLYLVSTIEIISFFSFLTFQRLHRHTTLSVLTKQLTRMTLFQTATVLVFLAQFGIVQAYSVAGIGVTKSAYRQGKRAFSPGPFHILRINISIFEKGGRFL